MTKTQLHKLGYKKGQDCYYKTRRCRVRPENKVTVQVQLHANSKWYDVLSIEGGHIEYSVMLRGIHQLKEWERFAFCL